MPSTYDFTTMRRYSPFRLAMADSAAALTFASAAGPETLISKVRLPAAGSACSEMIVKDCAFERVGAGAVPQATDINKTTTPRIALIIDCSASSTEE